MNDWSNLVDLIFSIVAGIVILVIIFLILDCNIPKLYKIIKTYFNDNKHSRREE